MRIPGRARGELTMFAVLVGGLLVVVGAYIGFALAFVDPVPAELWIGFGIVIVVASGLAGVAALLVFGSDRPSIEPAVGPAVPADRVFHLLVVADETIGGEELRREVRRRAGGRESDVLVVAPALNSPIHHWTNDDSTARNEAQARLDLELALLAGLGVKARGEVGVDDPLQAIADALRVFPADEILISTHPKGRENWLEEDLIRRAREAYHVPVTHVGG